MNKRQSRETSAPSKRQVLREQRAKRQRQQRLAVILGIGAIVVVVAALVIIPSLLQANQPVGEIVRITPEAYPLANGREIGNPDAPVLIEVFEDFQCPACQGYTEQIEPEVIKNLVETGQARYVFRNYPFLDDQAPGNESDQAANAAMCANEQGKFWEYHAMLYANWDGENEGAFADRRLVAFAEALGLDMAAFNSCFEENRFKADIDADIAKAIQMGVQGTPSVFVNGTLLRPGFVPSYDEIKQAVDAAQ